MDLTAFYQLLKDKTGVDLSAPAIPTPGDGQSTAVQTMIDGKANIAGTSEQRTFDREYKQKVKPASIYLQAQRAVTGETLLSSINTK
jgi:hypothetical protein